MEFILAISFFLVLCIGSKIYEIIEKVKPYIKEYIDKLKELKLNEKAKKQKKEYNKMLYQERFVMICNEKAINGNLKEHMSKIAVVDPNGRKKVIIFGSFWSNMKDFYIEVYGNAKGFSNIIKESNSDTHNILKEYLKCMELGKTDIAKSHWNKLVIGKRIFRKCSKIRIG